MSPVTEARGKRAERERACYKRGGRSFYERSREEIEEGSADADVASTSATRRPIQVRFGPAASVVRRTESEVAETRDGVLEIKFRHVIRGLSHL